MPVPRYLHEGWKKTATKEEQEQLEYEKEQIALTRNPERLSKEALAAAEQYAVKRQQLQAEKRKY